MPVRDAAGTLALAIRSVLRSRAVQLELVVVDHGSQDGSSALLAWWAERDARVRLLCADPAAALAEVLERGRRACAAPFIARMDADDVMHPDRLAADVAHLRSRPTLAAVASLVKVIPKGRTTAGWRAYAAWQNAVRTAEEHAREVWVEQPLCHPATTFRQAALDAVGGYRAAACPEDYDLFLRLIPAGHQVEKRAAVHHAWRQHALSSSRWPRDAFARAKARALVEHLRARTRPVVIAGAGKEGGRMARALRDLEVSPVAFLDVAERRIGRMRHGVVVLPSTSLPALRCTWPDVLVVGAVGTSGSRGVVRAQFEAAGFTEGQDCVVVA